MDLTDAWLILNGSHLAPARQRRLLEAFGDPRQIVTASEEALLAVEGITRQHVGMLRRAAQELDLPRLRQQMMALGLQLVSLGEAAYPPLLRETPDPPPLLFVQGELTARDERAVAIVGTRKCSPYGAKVARRLAGELARRGFTIVSGMAIGIDAEAHRGALEAGGRTIAVLGCGPDITYPPNHRQLREQIASQGAVLTEYSFGTPPLKELFPSRNRLIAGISLGTIVVEAPLQSGALITARLAAEAGREVMAVPGDIDNPLSRGCHDLIKNGARLVEGPEDVIEALGMMLEAVPLERPAEEIPVAGEEARVLEALSFQPRHVDEIIAQTQLPPAQINAALMLLEMKGLIRRFPGNMYVKL